MNRALVVGCAAYEDPDIAPLRYAHRDAARVAEVLTSTCGVAADDLVLLHDGLTDPRMRPTRSNLLRHLVRLAGAADDGILFFYFSGHGFQAADNTHYLLPIDCVRDAIEETALRFDLVVQHLGAATAPHVVLLLDACRNVVQGGKSAGDQWITNVDVTALCPPGVVTLCSCQPGAVSYESDTIRSGVFTEALCEAFSDANRCRTVYELDTFLGTRVPEIALAERKPQQTPHSRVEPLGVQQLELVSERKRNQWRAATPIGGERRSHRAAALQPVRPDPLIAIDFGTSYSIASHCRPGGVVELIPGPDGRPMVPSVVHFLPGLDYLVGTAAIEADHFRPAATIRHVKRALGQDITYNIDGRSITPELAASLIIRSLRRNAEESLGTPVRRCIAARPANFSRRQTAALERAFELADLELMRVVGEPNIASVLTAATSIGSGDEEHSLVVDLGGGTFDVALVESGHGIAEIKASAGSNTVGGLDFDLAVVSYAEEQLRNRHRWGGELTDNVRATLRREAERAKRDLGRRGSTTLLLQDLDYADRGLQDVSIDLDRDLFRRITTDLTHVVRDTLTKPFSNQLYGVPIGTWLTWGAKVLLAGQGTKIFTVREQLTDLFPGAPVVAEFQETAVAHGLGFYSGVLSKSVDGVLLLDALGFGIGVRVRTCYPEPSHAGERRSLMRPVATVSADRARNTDVLTIIDPATTMPTRRSEVLNLDGSPGTVHLLEVIELPADSGESFGVAQVRAAGSAIELTVDVDANHLIVLIVTDLTSEVATHYQLTNFGHRPWNVQKQRRADRSALPRLAPG
ncbi:Hsp70 family protein [Micromonospora sp. HK10]|uniref:Hsp70 family protein n=1 Tax=Micromonospora sp. HK10 TaxID=1538294 RepID=UPI0009E3B97B|nr:Hsp70 family protein [Micromonospora sp. HK10]